MENRWIWPFELEEQLGAGGMGVVYKARYVGNNRRVALKLLPDAVAANPTLSARFAREMEILKDLRHPHIVHCFGGTTEGKQWFYAMELVEGGTVDSVLREKGRLTWEQAIEYGVQVCQALEHAHDHGVIHRDLKPGNLLLTKAGRLKLADFGLALMSDAEKLTAAGKTLGTFQYMAPEQIRGAPPLTPRTDLYALGCVLFEMLTGKPPFTSDTPGGILHAHLQESPPRLGTLALDCPTSLEQLVADLLQKDPEKRPASARDVARRLRAIEPVTVVNPSRSLEVPLATRSTREIPTTDEPRTGAVVNWRGLLRQNAFALAGGAMLLIWVLSRGVEWRAAQLARPAERLWIAASQDAQPAVRIVAVRALGALAAQSSPAVARLTETLGDADSSVRTAAILALADAGRSARPAIATLMKLQKEDGDPLVRNAADDALRRIRESPSWFPWRSVMWLTLACGLLIYGVLARRIPEFD